MIVLRRIQRSQSLIVCIALHLLLASITVHADQRIVATSFQISANLSRKNLTANASLEETTKNNVIAPASKLRSSYTHFYANVGLAIVGIFLIGIASLGLAWGFRAHLQLQKEREKSREDINRLMRELDLAYAKKNQIITTMSHDVRQPLQTLAYLSAGLPDQHSAFSNIHQQISSVTQELNLLVNALYNLSKFDNELVLPNISIVNVEHILRDISHSYFSLVTAQGIQLHINHQNAWLKTDPHLLKHAIGILVENAIKHSGASHIWVEATLNDEGSALIKVRDNGKGIPKEDWPNIFDEFYQGKTSSQASKSAVEKDAGAKVQSPKLGMGLGLSLFTRIADLLEIKYGLNHPGADALNETMMAGPGLEFVLEMPELALAKEVRSESLKSMEEKRRRRELFENRFENNVSVWIVEPDHATASALAQMMQQWGVVPHVFTDFSDVKSGISRLHAPDLILTNNYVAGLEDPETLISKIRTHFKNEIEACVISNVRLESSIVREDIHYLVNPISPARIFDILYNVVDYKRGVARKKRLVKKIQKID